MRRWRRFWIWACALGLLAALTWPRLLHAATELTVVRVEGVINPIKVRVVERAIAHAQASRSELLLVTLDTPGGLVTSMQAIVSDLQNAGLPVVTYVTPRSAQASSAGAFILLAGDFAAMAPGTRTGAAHPVGGAGKELEGPINDKVTNSLSSLIRSLAERRGRPADEAESMVRKSISFTGEQAYEKKLVELIARDEVTLLRALDGRDVGGRTLHTRGLSRSVVEPSGFESIVDRLADPTLTSLLLSLGMLGLLYELATPGIGAGGLIGALLLVVGLLGSSVLPIELSAVALLLIGAVGIMLEAKVPTHGVLGGAGVLALLFGGLLLVDRSDYFGAFQAVNLALLLPVLLLVALGLALLVRAARQAFAAPQLTGIEALVDRSGEARTSFGREASEHTGIVYLDGARWQAESEEPCIRSGERVRVVSVAGQPTRLIVRRHS
jgi:membrane-bound serine protease (ClpP class)